jgi:hypothetical protein
MKGIWWVIMVAPLLVQFQGQVQGKRADFEGKWALDLKKSVNLPPQFSKVESYVIDIDQSGDSMTVLATMKGDGQTVPFPPFVYVVNGKETYRKDSLRGSERWMTAKWGKDGKSVVMDTRVRMQVPGKPPMEFSQHDEWLYGDTATINVAITQKMSGNDSTRSEKRIFRKQK